MPQLLSAQLDVLVCRCSLNPVRIVSPLITFYMIFILYISITLLLLLLLLRLAGSIEQSPKLMDRFRHGHLDSDYGHGDMRLKEDLADAMRESPSTAAARRDPGKCRDEFQNHNLGLLFSNICFVYCIETVLK